MGDFPKAVNSELIEMVRTAARKSNKKSALGASDSAGCGLSAWPNLSKKEY
jgi:hypothetical protein